VVSITLGSTIEDAAKKMVANKIRHLIVVDSRGHVVGILTVTDLARYLKGHIADERILESEVWELFF
jgi:CBS domain-containing protein